MKNQELKIGIFSLAYMPFVGGAEVAIKEITRRLPYDFTCFTYKFFSDLKDKEIIGNIEIARVGKGRKRSRNYYGQFFGKIVYIFSAWRAAERAHKIKPFHVIWAIMASYAGMAALLFKLRHPEIPLLLTLQEGDSEAHILKKVNIFYPLWRLLFKKADYIQVISNYLADFARRHGARCPVEVVPNGVNVEKSEILNPKSQTGSNFTNPNTKTIITTSRLVHKNGIDILIRAVAKLVKCQVLGVRCLILGSGPDEEKLKNLAKDLKIEDKIQFLGHIEPENVPKYLAQSDIFVRASRSEGLGNSFLEAMGASLPIIGTNVGGIKDFLKDSETGLFAKINDSEDLADKILLLIENEALRNKLIENGRKLVTEKYSWDNIVKKMTIIFQTLRSRPYTPNLKILVATGIYPPDIGGPATYSSLLAKELPKRGFKVGIVTYGPAGISRKIPKGMRHIIYFLICFFRAWFYDAIYAQDPVSAGLPAMLAAKLSGRKFLIRVAGDYAWEQATQRFGAKEGIDDFQHANKAKNYPWQVKLLCKIQKFVVGKADLVITPSKYFRELVSRWIKHPERVYAIYNGIKLENNQGQAVDYLNKEKIIISAGRLVPWKGFEILIELMSDLPDWKLVIVGDGPEYQNLKFKIENLKLKGRVRLTGGIPREELLNYLQKVRIFALNTSFESFSFQVVEAMNAGVPVITTNIGNLAEIIENSKEGILVEPNNKFQILSAIEKIDQDKNLREMIIQNAKQKARQFSIENTINNLEKLLKNLRIPLEGERAQPFQQDYKNL